MLNPGDKLSHYTIVSVLGSGGMGEVYLAEDTRLERQVALKVLLDEVSEDEDRVRRFILEAKAASALNHPNILTVYEIGEFKESRYIATELIKGETLRQLMNGESRKLRESLEIVLQVTAALGAAHEAGIIHRDIKPENIMIREDGLVKVLDFGLAKLWSTPVGSQATTLPQLNTLPGMLVGTVAYMSPEQARGRNLDPRSDIFSLGIVMFELFSGKRPFEGENHLDLVSSILKDDAIPLRQVSPDLPRQLERLVEKTLRKDRDHRYQHVKDLYLDIEDLKEELKFEEKLNQSIQPTIPVGVLYTDPGDLRSAFTTGISKTRRFTLLHAIIFVFAAALLVGGAWFFRPGSDSQAVMPGSFKTAEIATWNSAPGELFSNASFSPDGTMIAFASTKSGSKNIWVTQTGSTEPIQITNDLFSNVDPVYSPRGDEIAFFSAGGPSKATGIWRIPALGSGPARLIGSTTGLNVDLKRWTQSGKIYFQVKDGLYAMDVSSGTSQKVTTLEQSNPRLIDISPDEKTVAYAVQKDGAWTIVVGDLAGGQQSEVAKGPGEVDSFSWLSDKKRLFYSATVDGVRQIFVTQIGSGKSDRITASETDSSVLDVSRDGRSIIVNSAKEESNLWSVALAEGQESPLIRDLNAKLWPTVSPDNSKIAFQSVKNLSQGNKLFDSLILAKTIKPRNDGERPTQLAEHGSLPAWSPDGSVLAFIKQTAGKAEIFSVNPNGGGEKQLTSGGLAPVGYSVSPYNYLQNKAFAWSPDSSRIAYVSKKSGASNIWVVRPREGTEAMLTDNSDGTMAFFCPLWSADNGKLAFSSQKESGGEPAIRGLRSIDAESGQSIGNYEIPRFIRLIGWTADETGLIVAEPDKINGLPSETLLKRIPMGGGTETVIASLKNIYFYNIFLSDDRKYIGYAGRSDDRDDIWVMPSSGGVSRKLTANNDTGLYFSRLAWLHDGSAIVFGKQTRYSLLSLITDID